MRKLLCAVLSLAAFVFTGCEQGPKFTLRRVVVDGDAARFVGSQLVRQLKLDNVHISESAEKAPVLTAVSTVKKLESGVQVFTLELTDGAGLNIRTVVSTQDLPIMNQGMYIKQGIDQAVASLLQQWDAKKPTAAPQNDQQTDKPAPDPNKHFSTS